MPDELEKMSWNKPEVFEYSTKKVLVDLQEIIIYATNNKQYHILEGVQKLVSNMLKEASVQLKAKPVINDPRTAETVH
jgi:hypothetical protein